MVFVENFTGGTSLEELFDKIKKKNLQPKSTEKTEKFLSEYHVK